MVEGIARGATRFRKAPRTGWRPARAGTPQVFPHDPVFFITIRVYMAIGPNLG